MLIIVMTVMTTMTRFIQGKQRVATELTMIAMVSWMKAVFQMIIAEMAMMTAMVIQTTR